MDIKDKILTVVYKALENGVFASKSDIIAMNLRTSQRKVVQAVNAIKRLAPTFLEVMDGSGDSDLYIYPERDMVGEVKSFLEGGGFTAIEEDLRKKEMQEESDRILERELKTKQIEEIDRVKTEARRSFIISIISTAIALGSAIVAAIALARS